MPIKPPAFRSTPISFQGKKSGGVAPEGDDDSSSKTYKKAELGSHEKTAVKKDNSKTLAKNFAKTKLNKQKQIDASPVGEMKYISHDAEFKKTGSARYLDPSKLKKPRDEFDTLADSPLSPELKRVVFDVRNCLVESKKS